MKESYSPVVRPLSNIERLFAIRQNLGYYTNICSAVRYRCKEFFSLASINKVTELNDNVKNQLRPITYSILTEMLLEEPALSNGIRDLLSNQPVFVHIPTIDLAQLVRFDLISSDEELEKLLEEEHKRPLDHTLDTNPLWRITLALNTKRTDEIYVIFCWHHSLADGMSSHVLNSLFYNSLKKVLIAQNNLPNLKNVSSTASVPKFPISEPLEKAVNVRPSWILMLKEVINEYLVPSFMKSRPKHYVGDVHAMEIHNLRTAVKIVSFSPCEFKSLLALSRQQETTLHAVIHTAVTLSAHHYLIGSDKDQEITTVTPISLRPYAHTPITEPTMGVYVTSFDFTASADDINLGFWDLTRKYKSALSDNMDNSIQYVGLLKYLPNNTAGWEQYLKNKRRGEPMGRTGTVDISNIKVWKPNETEDKRIEIMDYVFSQSANVTGPPVLVNVTTYGDRLSCTIACQEGAIKPEEKFTKFIQGFKRVLSVLSSEGDWKGEWNPTIV